MCAYGRVVELDDAAHDTDDADGPGPLPVVLPHIAYFFVPLPDPLGLPDGHVVRIAEPAPAEWWRDGRTPPALAHVAASLLFHRAMGPSPTVGLLPVLFDVAARAMPDPDRPAPPGGPDGGEEPPGGMTIVEMAVGLDLDTVGGDPEDEDDENGPAHSAISDAFDRGLAYVRDVQRAYYIARRRPVRLVTRETLPFAVPLGIRRVYDDDGEPLPFRVPMSVFLLNMNLNVRDADLDAGGLQALTTAIYQQAGHGVFTSHLDLVREADVALDVDGAYRASVLFTATACEVLLDDLLAHMLWQERVRPEQAAEVFEGWLTARVKAQYHPRLGGNWSVDRDGPVRRWSTNVAALRNRVVHGGYEPTLDEARAAAEAAEALQFYLGDLIAAKAQAYPRTAVVLPGRYGLERRGKWTARLDAIQNDPAEVPWTETFARWRRAMQLARADPPAVPSTAAAWTYLVVRADGTTQWVVHDRDAGMAAAVDPAAVTGIGQGQRDQLDRIVAGLAADGDHDDFSVHVAGAVVTEPPTLAWIPEYRLVPLAGVMVDGNDLDPA